MIRAFAFCSPRVTLLAGVGHAQAQGVDFRDIMGGGPNFFLAAAARARSRATTVNFAQPLCPRHHLH